MTSIKFSEYSNYRHPGKSRVPLNHFSNGTGSADASSRWHDGGKGAETLAGDVSKPEVNYTHG
jgi:hypothetical protein